MQESVSTRHLKWVHTSLIIGIASYIVPLSIMAMSGASRIVPVWEAYIWLWSSVVSVYLMTSIPLVILVMIGAFGNTDKE